jgi:carbonic anhydrase/acetyltransferase-like protein (isoleucine patch superfamily)
MGLILSIGGFTPNIAPDVFIAETAVITGDVEIGPGSSIWYGVSIRGDSAPIRIGARVNIQDNSVVHADPDAPCTLADDVSVGHAAIVHGATVGAGTLIGMGAVLLSRSWVGAGAMVGARSLVVEDARVEDGQLVIGSPAKPVRMLGPEEIDRIAGPTHHYHALSREYLAEQAQRTKAGNEWR